MSADPVRCDICRELMDADGQVTGDNNICSLCIARSFRRQGNANLQGLMETIRRTEAEITKNPNFYEQ